jgi:hypothetical protein
MLPPFFDAVPTSVSVLKRLVNSAVTVRNLPRYNFGLDILFIQLALQFLFFLLFLRLLSSELLI